MRRRPLAHACALLASVAFAAPVLAQDLPIASESGGNAAISTVAMTAGITVASIQPHAVSNGGFVTVSAALPTQVAWTCMGTCAVWLRPANGQAPAGPVVAQAGVMRAGFSVRVARAALGTAYVASVYRWTGGQSYALLASGNGVVQ